MKIYVHTLGCKVNQYESQAMELMLTEKGHTICTKDDDFDAFIVNTCAVTAESGRKSRQIINKLRQSHPDAVCAVCGCYSQISADSAKELGADIIFGSGDRTAFIEALEKEFSSRQQITSVDDPMKRRIFEKLPSGNIGTRTRATLKIEDGCVNFCSYCIIPYARGPIRSLPLEDVADEAKKLFSEGYKEIILTGIEIGSYGKDLKNGVTVIDAIETVAKNAPNVRLRLGSLEPRTITEEFCIRLRALGAVCNHFHLSLQSGCDDTLSRMNRKYNTARFYESVELLRKHFPDCGITADLIVGFPGETEEDFNETLRFIEKCGFSHTHIFPYSIRPGTAAAKMKNQLTAAEKAQRAKAAEAVNGRLEDSFKAYCVGKTVSVLFETEKAGFSYGHSTNYVLVRAKGENLRNEIRDIYITGFDENGLIGEIQKFGNTEK